MDAVCEPVQQGARQPLGAEDLSPLVEGQVSGDHDRPPLVALAEDLEEELRSRLGEWNEAQFIYDEQLEPAKLLLQVEQSPLVPGLDQLMDEGCGGGEANRQPPSGKLRVPGRGRRVSCLFRCCRR